MYLLNVVGELLNKIVHLGNVYHIFATKYDLNLLSFVFLVSSETKKQT